MTSVFKRVALVAMSALLLLGASVDAQLGDPTMSFLMSFGQTIPNLAALWSGADYCRFTGVTCDTDGLARVRLDQVSTKGFRLEGSLPELSSTIPGGSVKVREINLHGMSRIRGSFPRSWGSLTQLQLLDLSNTQIAGPIPDEWNGMTKLTTALISGVRTCRSLPKWNISSMSQLVMVDFSNNRLQGTLSPEFGSFSSQTLSINLRGNKFCGCLPSTWTSVELQNAAKESNSKLTDPSCAVTNTCSEAMLMMCPSDAAAPLPFSPIVILLFCALLATSFSAL